MPMYLFLWPHISCAPCPPYRRLEQLRGEQRELRSRAEALEAEAAGIKREEESALERRDRLMTE
jgi:hypothetical protein